MKLNKKLVDEVIRITRKYYSSGDRDLFPAMREKEEKLKETISDKKNAGNIVDLIVDLARYSIYSDGSYAQIYKALEGFGIIVEMEETDDESDL